MGDYDESGGRKTVEHDRPGELESRKRERIHAPNATVHSYLCCSLRCHNVTVEVFVLGSELESIVVIIRRIVSRPPTADYRTTQQWASW